LDKVALAFSFRGNETLELLTQYALPDLKQRQFIRIWDAGCAQSPEPYSIAMMLREDIGQFLFRNVLIYATDIEEGNLSAYVPHGVYAEAELGRIPRVLFSKYFTPSGRPGYFQVNEELRRAVHFQKHDLLSLQPVREDLGLIVCNSVLPHLAPAQRVQVVRMFHRALAKDGLLILGRTEKLPGGTEPLFRQLTNAAQLFRKM
jgi:chemotaxis protein methyltransferase CheR